MRIATSMIVDICYGLERKVGVSMFKSGVFEVSVFGIVTLVD